MDDPLWITSASFEGRFKHTSSVSCWCQWDVGVPVGRPFVDHGDVVMLVVDFVVMLTADQRQVV